MKLILDNENDIINYINYMHENNKLITLFKEITVPDDEVTAFLSYLTTPSDVDFTTTDPNEDRAGKRWSQEEKILLQDLINADTPIQEIATSLRRTVESIRKQARTSLDAVYIDNEWLSMPF